MEKSNPWLKADEITTVSREQLSKDCQEGKYDVLYRRSSGEPILIHGELNDGLEKYLLHASSLHKIPNINATTFFVDLGPDIEDCSFALDDSTTEKYKSYFSVNLLYSQIANIWRLELPVYTPESVLYIKETFGHDFNLELLYDEVMKFDILPAQAWELDGEVYEEPYIAPIKHKLRIRNKMIINFNAENIHSPKIQLTVKRYAATMDDLFPFLSKHKISLHEAAGQSFQLIPSEDKLTEKQVYNAYNFALVKELQNNLKNSEIDLAHDYIAPTINECLAFLAIDKLEYIPKPNDDNELYFILDQKEYAKRYFYFNLKLGEEYFIKIFENLWFRHSKKALEPNYFDTKEELLTHRNWKRRRRGRRSKKSHETTFKLIHDVLMADFQGQTKEEVMYFLYTLADRAGTALLSGFEIYCAYENFEKQIYSSLAVCVSREKNQKSAETSTNRDISAWYFESRYDEEFPNKERIKAQNYRPQETQAAVKQKG